jgi:hypothetical protein
LLWFTVTTVTAFPMLCTSSSETAPEARHAGQGDAKALSSKDKEATCSVIEEYTAQAAMTAHGEDKCRITSPSNGGSPIRFPMLAQFLGIPWLWLI